MKKATFIFLIFGLLLLAATSYAPAQGSSITLQWAPSLSNGVVGYNIYRSKSSGSGYERLNTQLIIGTSFEDDTIQTGIDYYYVCRAVTIDGTESVNSNEAILVQADLNSAPEAADDTVQTQEDTPAIILPLTNDYDGDDDPLQVTAVSDPPHGSASVISASEIRYTPDADFSGSDTMTYTVADPGGKTDTGTITVTVSPVNDPPTASADSATTNEDTAVEINLLANDSDPDNDSLTVQILENPAHGTLQALTTGRYRYQPRENYFGSDSFSYRITDAGNSTAEASVSITVRSVNDAPIAVNDAFTTMEDNPATINLLANDSDIEGDALTISITVQPANGSTVVLANGTVTYTPRPDYNGPDSFTYRVTDSGGAYGTALVSVTVAPGADVFRAMADSLSIVEDGTGVINLLSNDENPDSLSLTVSIQSQPMHGQVQVLSAGEISYTPAADYSGTDSFTYALSDPNGNTSVATVSISVSGVNDPPVAVADSITVNEDQSATVMLLANDFDAEGDTLSASLRSAPSHGRVTVSLNGEAVYTPNPDFSGSDSFFYEVSDGSALSTARVTIRVSPVNDPPRAVDDNATTGIGEAVELNVLGNDSDPDGDDLSASLVSSPGNGSVTIQPNGRIVYTPSSEFTGNDSFVYRASDPSGESSSAAVRIQVKEINHPPVAIADSASVKKKSTVTINVLSNDSDPDGDSLELMEITSPANGTATIKNPAGDIEYSPEIWFRGSDTFNYTVTDGKSESIGTVTVSVSSTPSVLKFSFPRSIDNGSTRLQDTYIGVGVINPSNREENVSFIGFDQNGTTRDVISLGQKLPPQGQVALMTSELGNTDKNVEQLTVEGESGDVQGFFMVGDVETNRLDGVGGVQIPARFFYLPVAREDNNATTLVYLISQDSQETALVSATLHQIDGNVLSTRTFEITPNGSFSGSIRKIFGEETELADGYIKISSSTYLSGYEIIATEKSIYAFSARRILSTERLSAPHFIAGAGNDSEIRILNNSEEDIQSVVTLMDDSGQTMVSKSVQIGAARLTTLDLAGLLKEKYDLEARLLSGSILVEFDHQAEVSGTITMSTSGGEAVTAMPLASQGLLDFIFPQVAQSADGTIFMGFAIMNPGNQTANATLSVYNDSGVLTASKQLVLPPLHRITDLLSGESLFGAGFSQMGGHIKLTSDQPLVSVSIYGDYQGRYLSTVEGQLGEVETAAASAELERSMAEEID